MTVTSKKKTFVSVLYFKVARQRDNRLKVSALHCAGHKVNEVTNLVGLSRTTVRCQQTCRQWSKDCCESWQLVECHLTDCFVCGTPFDGQLARFHSNDNSLSNATCTSKVSSPSSMGFLIAQTIVRDRQGLRPHSHYVPHEEMQKIHSIVLLRSHFEIHNNNKPFSSMSQSQSIGRVKQKPDNNCQTTRIVTESFF